MKRWNFLIFLFCYNRTDCVSGRKCFLRALRPERSHRKIFIKFRSKTLWSRRCTLAAHNSNYLMRVFRRSTRVIILRLTHNTCILVFIHACERLFFASYRRTKVYRFHARDSNVSFLSTFVWLVADHYLIRERKRSNTVSYPIHILSIQSCAHVFKFPSIRIIFRTRVRYR